LARRYGRYFGGVARLAGQSDSASAFFADIFLFTQMVKIEQTRSRSHRQGGQCGRRVRDALDIRHLESDVDENCTAHADLRRYREPRLGQATSRSPKFGADSPEWFAHQLRNGPRLCRSGGFGAGRGAGSGRRDDSVARTKSKGVPCGEELTFAKMKVEGSGFFSFVQIGGDH
jgi:hypothetical protein